jgi:ubiquinone/menaquinone biosynthesis C-methylase UbiE
MWFTSSKTGGEVTMEIIKHLHAGEPKANTIGQMGKWAPYYDSFLRLVTIGRERTLREMTVTLAQIKPGDKVLEVGCGTGTLSMAAKARVGPSGEVYGIDAAPEMIEVARKKVSQANVDVVFRVGQIENISFPNNQFDVVLCSFMIFVITDDMRRKGFLEIRRVLKPNGQLLVLDFSPPANILLRHLVTLLFGRRHSLQRIFPMMEEAGFTEIEIRETNYKVLSFVRGKSNK